MHERISFWINIEEWFAIAVTVLAIIAGIYRFKKIILPSRIMLILLIVGFWINKAMDAYQNVHFNYPLFLYLSYFSSFILMALFFNYCIPQFRKMRIGIYFALTGVIFWAFYSYFFQPMRFDENNKSYPFYTSFFGICILACSLWALYFMLRDHSWKQLRRNEVFWFIMLNVLGYALDFINDIALPLAKSELSFYVTSMFLNYIPNDLSVIANGIIFIRFPKKTEPIE